MKVFYSPFLVLLFFFCSTVGFSEGSKELNAGVFSNDPEVWLYLCNDFINQCNGPPAWNGDRTQFAIYGCANYERLYFETLNSDEIVYLGFKGGGSNISFQIRQNTSGNPIVFPQQGLPTNASPAGFISNLPKAKIGPTQIPGNIGGYNAITFSPGSAGTYFIEFNLTSGTGNFTLDLFDITVYNPVTSTIKPGRVYSQAWQFQQQGNNSGLSGPNYIYTNDSIITSATFNNLVGGVWVQFCNISGCGPIDGNDFIHTQKSHPGENTYFPQYKIFLNSPDPDYELFPPATVLGAIITTPPDAPYGIPNCNGHIVFYFKVNKAGSAQVKLSFPSPYVSVKIPQDVTTGWNTIEWDGNDNSLTPVPVPNNVPITISLTYLNGLTNLPLYDVEANNSGFKIDLVAPTGANPEIYYNDTLINSNNSLQTCPPSSSCHPWGNGNLHTMNTWWYSSTNSEAVPSLVQFRSPSPLVFNQPAQTLCAGTNNVTFSVAPDVNTEVYHWNYTGTGATITQLNPGDPTVTINFAADATPGNWKVEVYGANTNCSATTPGPTTQLDVTIQSIPDLTTSLTGHGTCSGVAFSIPLTSSPSGASFSWSAPTCSANIALPLPIAGSGNPLTGILSVTNLVQGTVTYPITPTANGCNGVTKNLVVTVDPKPNITSPTSPSENLCSGGTTNIALQSGLAGATINWQVLTEGCDNIVTCPGSGSSSPIANQLTLANSSSSGFVAYTITPSLGGCSGNAVTHTVYVLQLPPVALTQFAPVCENTPQFSLIPYGTPTGGTFTLNGTPITTFNPATAGAGTYHIIYTLTDANGCTASDAKDLLVQSLIIPNLLGHASVCVGVTESYTTDPGMVAASYVWSVSDGTMVAGVNPWEVTITWNTPGPKTIGVTYTDPNGCTTTPASKIVNVNPLPTPFLVSPNINVCNQRPYTYTTQPGMQSYTWTVSPGNTITPNGNTATVTWNTISNAEWIKVNYVNANGCTAVAPTSYTVNVNPTPMYVVTGEPSVCAGSTNTYKLQGTERGNWTITPGGTIAFPATNVNSISVDWVSGTSPASSSIGVTYTNTLGCAGVTTTNVNIQPLPVTTFTATPSTVCQDFPTPYLYTVSTAGAAATYFWQVSPANAADIADPTANPASISWKLSGTTPQTAQLSVTATTSATTPACIATSSPATMTINPKPNTQLASGFDLVTSRSAKKFLLKGGTPLLTATPNQGEYLISPATSALTFEAPNYYFDPAMVSGNMPVTFDISYKYTSAQYGCPSTSAPLTITVLGLNAPCGTLLHDYRDNTDYTTSATLVPGKCWMLQNLRYGQSPPTSTSPQTDNCLVERNCLASDPTCAAYGGFYQWDELIQYESTAGPAYQGVCPPGWHIPSSSEWQDLIDAVANLPGIPGDGVAANYLTDENNNSGFKALLKGFSYLDNAWTFTSGDVIATMFWTSTRDATNADHIVVRGLNNYNYSVSKYPASRANAFPVRCVKD